MRQPINQGWYTGFAILITVLVWLVNWGNIYFMANLGAVSGVLFLIRATLLKFGFITCEYKNQFYSDLFMAIILFFCTVSWFNDPNSDVGYFLLLLGFIIKAISEEVWKGKKVK